MCDHDFRLWANPSGSSDVDFSTVYYCSRCGERKYVQEFIPAPLDYDYIGLYIQYAKAGASKAFLDALLSQIIKDEDLYTDIWGDKIHAEVVS